jgi:hypothetical protein
MVYNLLSMRKDGARISMVRDCIRRNLYGNPGHDRAGQYASASTRRTRRAALSHLGDILAAAIRDDDETAALDALNDNYRYISRDSEWIDRLESWFRGNYFCCYDCSHLGDYNDSNNYQDDYRICECCTDNYYWSERNEYYTDTEDDDDDTSDEGYHNIGNYHSSRHNLGHIASRYDDRKPRVLVGMELEMEFGSGYDLDDKAQDIKDAIGTVQDRNGYNRDYCLLEHDGSLGHGFEMVTGYTGLDIHARQLAWFKNKFPGATSHNTSTCGLHVHICKADMSLLHAAKMILFINDPQNIDLIKCLARRDASGYAKFQNKADDKSWLRDAMRSGDSKARQLRNINSDRYEALNFQNDKTVEFRLFRGSLKYATIMACLEFAYITWFFSRDTSQTQLTTQNFLKYICLENNRRDTAHLRAYLIDKGYQLPFQAKARPAADTINLTTTEGEI